MDSVQNWQHGDIAIAVNYEGEEKVVRYRRRQWVFADGSTMPESGTQVRRLVVIDPEDREQVERLAQAIGAINVSRLQERLREFVTPTPPKPDEPGRWGVVEASCAHSPRRLHWMRHEDDNWWPFAPYGEDDRRPLPDDWDSLVDPVVVHDGVAGEPS